MNAVTRKQYLFFLFTYPFIHAAVLVLVFFLREWEGSWDSVVSYVFFGVMFILTAPFFLVQEGPFGMKAIMTGWHPVAAALTLYAAVLLLYGLPALLVYKKIRRA